MIPICVSGDEREHGEHGEGAGEDDPGGGDHAARHGEPLQHRVARGHRECLLAHTCHEEDVVVHAEGDEEDEGEQRIARILAGKVGEALEQQQARSESCRERENDRPHEQWGRRASAGAARGSRTRRAGRGARAASCRARPQRGGPPPALAPPTSACSPTAPRSAWRRGSMAANPSSPNGFASRTTSKRTADSQFRLADPGDAGAARAAPQLPRSEPRLSRERRRARSPRPGRTARAAADLAPTRRIHGRGSRSSGRRRARASPGKRAESERPDPRGPMAALDPRAEACPEATSFGTLVPVSGNERPERAAAPDQE